MRCRHHRDNRMGGQLAHPVGGCAQECFRFLALAEFQQTFPQTDTRIIQGFDS